MAQNRAPAELSKHETDVLLGLYSGCECLWNTKNVDYNEKRIRTGAYQTIINGMRLETGKEFTLDQVQGTLKAIRDTYKQELQHVTKGESGSDVGFRPQWRWFHFLDSFLRDHALQEHNEEPVSMTELGEEGSSQNQVEDSKQVDGNESPDTDDYYCAMDSGDEVAVDNEDVKTAIETIPQQQIPSDQASKDTRSVRTKRQERPLNSQDRPSTRSLVNGVSFPSGNLVQTPTVSTRQSSRKKRRVSDDVQLQHKVVDAHLASTSRSRSINRTSTMNKTTSNLCSVRVRSDTSSQSKDGADPSHICDSLHISSKIADTLRAVQTLLATSLTDQEQPSMVFARHVANELQQIENYSQRKQCMLDIQQTIVRYQTRQQHQIVPTSVKHEGSFVRVNEEEMARGIDRSGGNTSLASSQPSCSEESLLVYFDTA